MNYDDQTKKAEGASDKVIEFDPAQLRLSQDFTSQVGVKKLITTIPVRKPDPQWFFRTHPDDAYTLPAAALELRDEREMYLVEPEVAAEIAEEVKPKLLVTSITRQGTLFLWPINLPRSDGRLDNWSQSATEAAQRARVSWTRIVANMSLGAYEVFEAQAQIPEPAWPDLSFSKILEIAFRNHVIRDVGHPVLRKLRGAL
jgi:hypothetical protein